MTFLGVDSPVYAFGSGAERNRRLTILARAAESGAGVAVAVMGGAQQPEIVRLGAAAAGIRHDVIDLQQVL